MHCALDDDGLLLLEPHTFGAVRTRGQEGRRWQSQGEGLFSPGPHLVLTESSWVSGQQAATTRFCVLDAETCAVERYAQSMQAYTEDGYRRMLNACGFGEISFFPSLIGREDAAQPDLMAIVARRQ